MDLMNWYYSKQTLYSPGILHEPIQDYQENKEGGGGNFHQLIIIKEKYEENYDLYTLYDKFIYNK